MDNNSNNQQKYPPFRSIKLNMTNGNNNPKANETTSISQANTNNDQINNQETKMVSNSNVSPSKPLPTNLPEHNSFPADVDKQNENKENSADQNSPLDDTKLSQSLVKPVLNDDPETDPVIESKLLSRYKQKPHPDTTPDQGINEAQKIKNTQQKQNFYDTQPIQVPAEDNYKNASNQPEPPINIPTTEEHIIQSTEPISEKKGGNKKARGIISKIFIIAILLSIIVIISSSALVYAIAYEKINIPDKSIQRKVAHFVMSYVPFAPPTPQYIIEKSALAHQNVTRYSYDLSFALNTDQGSLSSFGFDNFDMKADGAVDFTQPNNILATADVSVTNSFGMQLMTKDNVLHFKISEFPTDFLSLLDIDPAGFDPLIDQWFMYDTSTLESEARTFLDEEIVQKEENSKIDEKDTLNDVLDEKILKNITLSDDTFNGYDTYKLEFIADGEMIDYLVEKAERSQPQSGMLYSDIENQVSEKPSDIIKEFKIIAWIEKDTFYTRKVIFSATIVSDEKNFDISSPLGFFIENNNGKAQILMTGAIVLDNFNEEVVVEIPKESIQAEEIYKILNEAIYGQAGIDFSEETNATESSIIIDEDILNSEEYLFENYYKLENVNDVLGWFGERLK
ncbi:hypothetical protein JXA63_02200 [Candidatus Woesebacteria bacterium]|nr:hypothetical protein [Candidatus Woesebacteria bacterium]